MTNKHMDNWQVFECVGYVGSTRDLKYTRHSATAIFQFSVAVNHPSEKVETQWFLINTIDDVAEHCNANIKVGSKVHVTGVISPKFYIRDDAKFAALVVDAENVDITNSEV